MQFYPGDWLKDPSLRSVSLAARGLWIELLCRMFECDRRGYLQVNGKPASLAQIARMAGCDTDEASLHLRELDDSGVFSRTPHGSDGEEGCIYSRRMVRDEANKKAWRENGKKGGNPKIKDAPNLVEDLDNQNSNQKGQGGVNQNRRTSSSTSVNSPSPARGRGGGGGGTAPPDPESPGPKTLGESPPESLVRAGEAVLGLMPEPRLRLLLLDCFPAEWIEKALLESGRRELKGKRALDYARGILREWTRNGGPENGAAARREPRREGGREVPDYSDVETGASL
ncbi:MAG: hypothetical protein LBU23_02280 [Planctomycetota bacterium]|nr:hypothetical protein [Planctomycetota bacterium]